MARASKHLSVGGARYEGRLDANELSEASVLKAIELSLFCHVQAHTAQGIQKLALYQGREHTHFATTRQAGMFSDLR